LRLLALIAAFSAFLTAVAADARVSPGSPVSAIEQALSWKPPGYPRYAGYVRTDVADTGQACPTLPDQNPEQYWVCRLAPNRDYLIHLGHRSMTDVGSLVFTGGRSVVIIGGEVEIRDMPDAEAFRREALVFHGQTGVVHVEGVHIYGKPLRCIVFDSAAATFQIENVRCDGVYMWQEDFGTAHSDTWVTWLSPPEIRFDRFTGDFDNTGFAIFGSPIANTWPRHVTLRRVNLRNSPTFPGGGNTVVVSRKTRLDIDRFYTTTGWGRAASGGPWPSLGPRQWKLWDSFVDETWRSGRVRLARFGNGVARGSYMLFTRPRKDNVLGVGGRPARISYGIPPRGDFVPVGVAGTSYVSPGYR
jgi:hypothetical protein